MPEMATRCVIPVHLFGRPVEMDPLLALCRERGIYVIEDACQAHGALYRGRPVGSLGDAGCFSFYPTKNLGAVGDAGAVVTDNDELADRLRHLRNYGSKQKYVNRYAGINSRLDELQAALLRVKLKHLDAMTQHKRELAAAYEAGLPAWVQQPVQRADEFDVFHIYAIRHPQRDALRQYLLEAGVKTEVHYPIPPHHQEAMRGILSGAYPISEELHATELSLPISNGHTVDDIDRVCALLIPAGELFGLSHQAVV
jgi:dTDP-4-amino-4,6-dideoxygalactose transaminase